MKGSSKKSISSKKLNICHTIKIPFGHANERRTDHRFMQNSSSGIEYCTMTLQESAIKRTTYSL
eukprot:scaffold2134_cov93-Cylindrotheca_fusiformis.AAC.12